MPPLPPLVPPPAAAAAAAEDGGGAAARLLLGQIASLLAAPTTGTGQRHNQQQQRARLAEARAALAQISSPAACAEILAPLLFSSSSLDTGKGGDGNAPPPLSPPLLDGPATAVAVLTHLAESSPGAYLGPAARAVRKAAEASTSASASASSLSLPPAALNLVAEQLGGRDVGAADAAGATLLALARGEAGGPDAAARCVEAAAMVGWRAAGGAATAAGTATGDRALLSTASVRCAAAVAGLACLGDGAMAAATAAATTAGTTTSGEEERSGTDLILALLEDGTDPLLQLSALDLIEGMAEALPMHGARARWLCSSGVLDPLLAMAGEEIPPTGNDVDDDREPEPEPEAEWVADPFLGGPALRTLANLGRVGGRYALAYGLEGNELPLLGKGGGRGGRFRTALIRFAREARGETDRLALIGAASALAAASPAALDAVLDEPDLRDGWLGLDAAQPRLKAAVLHSVAGVIDPIPVTDGAGDKVPAAALRLPSEAVLRLFGAVGTANGGPDSDDGTDGAEAGAAAAAAAAGLVLAAARSALAEVRLGAYALLHAVAARGPGALLLLAQHGGLYGLLTDREAEDTKEGREARHGIVGAVLASGVRDLLADAVVETLEKMYAQGPHHVQPAQFELAMGQ